VLLTAIAVFASILPCPQIARAQVGDEFLEPEEQAPPPAEPEPELKGFYFHPGWLLYFIFAAAIWLGVLAWVNKDTEKVEESSQLWCGVLLGLGLIHFLLPWVLPASLFVGVFIGAVLFIGGSSWYIVLRNGKVSERDKVLTPAHLGKVSRFWLSKIGIRLPAPSEEGAVVGGHIPVTFLDGEGKPLPEFQEGTPQASALGLAKDMLGEAASARASAIHLEPKADQVVCSYRIDGVLHQFGSFPKEVGSALTASLRVLARLRDAPAGKASRGRLGAELPTLQKRLGLNIAGARVSAGDRMLIRVEEPESRPLKLADLGLSPEIYKFVKACLDDPHGVLMVSTSKTVGQTTTLYALLGALDVYQRNIMTLETSPARQLANITQTRITGASESFAPTLRATLRQEPDVVMISALKDRQTAEVMFEAASEKQLFLAGMLADDAKVGLVKLLEMGVRRELIASSLLGVMSQILLRVLCPSCRQAYRPTSQLREKLKLPEKVQVLYRATGRVHTEKGEELRCPACTGTGYRGLTGAFEVLTMSAPLKEALRRNAPIDELDKIAASQPTIGLRQALLQKVVEGVTSLAEAKRVFKD
jgi:type II secretory ATPase GspE/PulE/Tfp pilus assembly ATPase PilB-like protein